MENKRIEELWFLIALVIVLSVALVANLFPAAAEQAIQPDATAAVVAVATVSDATIAKATPSVQPDNLLELHFMRQVFDASYQGPFLDLEYPARTPVMLVEWEEVYFNREAYRSKLESLVATHWPIGSWWWEVQVDIVVPEPLNRGGPILFTVDYPTIEFRRDLVYSVTKDATGTTVVVVASGEFQTPRFSYPIAMLLMLLTFVVAIGLGILLGERLLKVARWIVRSLTEWLMGGRADPELECWTRRFVLCILGAIVCIVPTVAYLVLVLT